MIRPVKNSSIDLIDRLRGQFGDRITISKSVRELHGQDESYHAAHPPDAVFFAETEEEIQSVVKDCSAFGVPIIPFGTGTSLEGHVSALKGGICIDLSRMNKILQVNAEDLDCCVEPGVTRKQLSRYLRDTGLFFPVDPGADASIGGMTATRASGTNAVRYGTMRENVLSLTVVLSDGRIIKTSRRARKSAAGYDLTRLFVGSEGTLGVITDITLRLYGIPEAISAAVCAFPDLETAVNSVILIIQSGIPVARIELLDEVQMSALNDYSSLNYEAVPTLFFEFHGTNSSVEEQSKAVQEIVGEFGAKGFKWAKQSEERTKLWEARHNAYYACKAMRPNAKGIVTDVCVPISRLAECLLETKKDIEKSDLLAPIVGHVGDGNFHLSMMVDMDDKNEVKRAHKLNERLIMRALSMDGTCTGEHGVGYGKTDFLLAEHGEAVSVMRSLKQSLDPANIMNPGKIIAV